MTLREWMTETETSQSGLTRMLGLTNSRTVHRYVHGERIPRADIMRKIVVITGGAVTANDFYEGAL